VLKINTGLTNISSFSKTKKSVDNKKITFKYQFKYIKNHLDYIVREFSDRDSSVKQIFYTITSSLIFSTETITYYYGKDSVGWGGAYYFYKWKLKDYETLGHGKSEDETWNPEVEVLKNYRKAKADILAHLKKKNGG